MVDRELLSAIAARPRDDQARWRAATEYERDGQAQRAQFIRTQLAIARLPFGIDDPEWFALTRESRQLLQENEEKWLAADELFEPKPGRFRFDRGFVELVEMSVPQIVDEGLIRVVERAPIQHVDVLPPRGDVNPAVLFRSLQQQAGPQLVSLGLARLDLGDDDIGSLTQSIWPRLRWLSLAGNRLTHRGVGRIAARWTEQMPALEYVDLLGNEFDPANQVEYDQDVVLRWRDEAVLAMEREFELAPVPWLRPMLEGGRIRPVDRLEFGRPQHVPEAVIRG
jgi:hypothetical protein